MFKKFRELFSSENLLEVAYGTTVTMLEYDLKMYGAARTVLRETDLANLPFDIRRMDRKINKYEREVRRNVLTHLTVSGPENLAPGLILVSIVIDVERIGDYTKNIVELASMHPEKLDAGDRERDLLSIEDVIDEHFPVVIDVLKTQDKALGRQVMSKETRISKLSDDILGDMVRREDGRIVTRQAVSIALYARYLKRINAHLTNIASAIVNPFPRIGFREKPRTK